MKNTGENSGEIYKLSSDVGVYIFVLLKSSKAGFLNESWQAYHKPTFCRFYSTLQLFSSAKVGVWGVKAMFSDCHV